MNYRKWFYGLNTALLLAFAAEFPEYEILLLILPVNPLLAVGMFVLTVLVPLLAALTLLAVAIFVVRRMGRRPAPALRTT